jgi:CRP-like cAMP-binding protein
VRKALSALERAGLRAALFDAVAAEDCEALAFTRQALDRALGDAEGAAFIARALAAEVAWLHRFIADEDSQGKVLSFLLSRRRSLAGLDTGSIVLTQAAMAQALGLTRETVNRQLKELEGRGLLAIGRGEIVISDWDALAVFSRNRAVKPYSLKKNPVRQTCESSYSLPGLRRG